MSLWRRSNETSIFVTPQYWFPTEELTSIVLLEDLKTRIALIVIFSATWNRFSLVNSMMQATNR